MSVLCKFKRPILIDKDEPFLEVGLVGFQAREHYTPNLAQEINLSRIQRRINVDRVSIRKGAEIGTAKLDGSHEVNAQQHAARSASVEAESVGVTNWPNVGAAKRVRPPFTHADSYSRCFRIELGTTNSPCPMMHSQACADWVEQIVRLVRLSSSKPMQSRAGTNQGKRPSVARYLNSIQLDRVTQTKQGGCLYEWPCSQNYGGLNAVFVQQPRDNLGVSSPFWQKPGIGVRPSVRSSSLKALLRGKDSPVLSGMMPRALCYRPVRLPTEERGGAMVTND